MTPPTQVALGTAFDERGYFTFIEAAPSQGPDIIDYLRTQGHTQFIVNKFQDLIRIFIGPYEDKIDAERKVQILVKAIKLMGGFGSGPSEID